MLGLQNSATIGMLSSLNKDSLAGVHTFFKNLGTSKFLATEGRHEAPSMPRTQILGPTVKNIAARMTWHICPTDCCQLHLLAGKTLQSSLKAHI